MRNFEKKIWSSFEKIEMLTEFWRICKENFLIFGEMIRNQRKFWGIFKKVITKFWKCFEKREERRYQKIYEKYFMNFLKYSIQF